MIYPSIVPSKIGINCLSTSASRKKNTPFTYNRYSPVQRCATQSELKTIEILYKPSIFLPHIEIYQLQLLFGMIIRVRKLRLAVANN